MRVAKTLRVAFVEPGKYAADGYAERFCRGGTLKHLRRELFGVALVPSPYLLRLPESDQAFTRGAGLAAPREAP